MTTNRSQKLKFLGIELLKNDATKTSKPDTGLFRGLWDRSDDVGDNKKSIKLILLGTKDKENDLKAFNLAVYNVMSVRMMYGDTKELIVFKNSPADQEAALEILEEALADFQTEKRMVDNDPEIIDTTTFESVPQEFFAPTDPKSSTTSTNYGYNYNGAQNNSDWQKKQDEREARKKEEEKMRWTPTSIGRKGELPSLKTLNAIKKKVTALAGGEYEECFKDPDPEDTFTDGKKTATAAK